MNRYIKVQWLHSHSDEPEWMFSELNEDRWETRKVELFRDGTVGIAGSNGESGVTSLSIEPIPEIDEIASDPQFVPSEISREEFECVWQKAIEFWRR